MELEKVNEGMVLRLEKTKFGRKATEDMESMSSVDEVMVSHPYPHLGEERGCDTRLGLGLFNLLLGHLCAHFIYKSIRK